MLADFIRLSAFALQEDELRLMNKLTRNALNTDQNLAAHTTQKYR